MYSINFAEKDKTFQKTVICLLMVKKLINLKQKILRLQQLHYAQETFQKTGQQKTGLNGKVYDFSTDYVAATVDDILYIHNYLMKKSDIV